MRWGVADGGVDLTMLMLMSALIMIMMVLMTTMTITMTIPIIELLMRSHVKRRIAVGYLVNTKLFMYRSSS